MCHEIDGGHQQRRRDHLPDIEPVPAPMRGRTFLSLRFAYPGETDRGAELARPLREAATVFADDLGPMPIGEVARILNDPPANGPGRVRGMTLERLDQQAISAILAVAGPGVSQADGLLTPWAADEDTVNFIGKPSSAEHLAGAWSAATNARPAEIRHRYDPDAVLH